MHRSLRSATRRLMAALVMITPVTAGFVMASPASADDPAPAAPSGTPAAISGNYIVVLKDDARARRRSVPDRARDVAQSKGARTGIVYEHALQGFTMQATPEQAKEVAADPNVAFVEQDREVSINADQVNPPSWGLDRVDQRRLPLNSLYSYARTADNVNAYVIDTGIRFSHADFGGRATSGRDFVDNDNDASDCNGHGTHVAGTIGGSTYGVAKGVRLIGVRVLNCSGSGTISGVIAGVDWVTANAVKPAVANMSLGVTGGSAAIDAAVANSINSGVTYAVAAGNNNGNACNNSPARTPAAITVGATTTTDARASYSNWGQCLDIFAPGSDITSAWYTSSTARNTISGTSMASPHVAGAAALYLSANPTAGPAQVRNAIVGAGTTGVVTGAGTNSPNVLLYTGP
ncbi:S8 family peptidase [Thermopolyspora sp. NPDC052614]|uniref:S8 family peptidase n=1 Tax=Thermopolyspora sp. NPDC052614 TaxID=3155682 RepID=UPI00341F1315